MMNKTTNNNTTDPRAVGDLEGFPTEIIDAMLDEQERQGNPRDVSVFQNDIDAYTDYGGFDWGRSRDGCWFWIDIFCHKNFDVFFEKYPKQQ